MLRGGAGQLRPPANERQSDLLWFIACFCLGFVGLIALTIPLFGFLNYAAALVFPFVVLAEIGFGVAAVVAGGRWRRAYVLGNLGLVAGNVAIMVLWLVILFVQPGQQPDTDVWRPVYFGVVLMGLAGGITSGILLRSRPR
jgi:hypothetical protein